jgi:hypothetical protein
MRSSVRARLAPPYFQLLTAPPRISSVPLCPKIQLARCLPQHRRGLMVRAITSTEKQCGKTRLLETLDVLVHKPWLTGRAALPPLHLVTMPLYGTRLRAVSPHLFRPAEQGNRPKCRAPWRRRACIVSRLNKPLYSSVSVFASKRVRSPKLKQASYIQVESSQQRGTGRMAALKNRVERLEKEQRFQRWFHFERFLERSSPKSNSISKPRSPVGCFIVAFFRLIARLNPRETSLRVA